MARVDVEGVEALSAAFTAAGAEATSPRVMGSMAGLYLDAARPPRRTGRLAGSGRVESGPGWAEVVWGAPYALPVHTGSGPHRPQGGGNRPQPWVPRARAKADGLVVSKWVSELSQALANEGLS